MDLLPYYEITDSAAVREMHLESNFCYNTQKPGGSGRDGGYMPGQQTCHPACNCVDLCYVPEMYEQIHVSMSSILERRAAAALRGGAAVGSSSPPPHVAAAVGRTAGAAADDALPLAAAAAASTTKPAVVIVK